MEYYTILPGILHPALSPFCVSASFLTESTGRTVYHTQKLALQVLYEFVCVRAWPAFRESSKSAREGSMACNQAAMPVEHLLTRAF